MAKEAKKLKATASEEKETEALQSVPTGGDLVTTTASVSDFYDDVPSDSADILIPKLLLMQGTSEAVGDEKAEAGSTINSLTTETLAVKGKPLEIIPIKEMPKTWVIERFDEADERFVFDHVEQWKPADKDLPWEFQEAGQRYRRSGCLNFFVLVASEVGKDTMLPYMISFRRTNSQAGKKLHTYFELGKMAFKQGNRNSIPMAKVLQLVSKVQKKDKNAWFVYDLDLASQRAASADEKEAGVTWFKNLKTTQVKVDESDLKQSEGPETLDEGSDSGNY